MARSVPRALRPAPESAGFHANWSRARTEPAGMTASAGAESRQVSAFCPHARVTIRGSKGVMRESPASPRQWGAIAACCRCPPWVPHQNGDRRRCASPRKYRLLFRIVALKRVAAHVPTCRSGNLAVAGAEGNHLRRQVSMHIAIPIHSLKPCGVKHVALRLAAQREASRHSLAMMMGCQEDFCADDAPALDCPSNPEPALTARYFVDRRGDIKRVRAILAARPPQ